MKKSQSVIRWFDNSKYHWRLHEKFDNCQQVAKRYSSKRAGICYKSRLSYRIHQSRVEQIKRQLRPAWGPWAFPDSCLREISRRETVGTYSPTIWNYGGSGAYGIGQALPAKKMKPYGADYMTNPWTQLRWMIHYVDGRYGGSCAALSFHNANGWY